MAVSFREHQAANRRKTWLLLGLMFLAVIGVLWAVGNLLGMNASWLVPVAVGIALIGVWASYWNSDKLVLAMTGARVISHEDAPQLYNVVEQCMVLSPTPVIGRSLVARALRQKPERLLSLNEARDQFERDYLIRLLNLTEGNIALAARLAERNRSEFYNLLGRHGLDPEQFRRLSEANA